MRKPFGSLVAILLLSLTAAVGVPAQEAAGQPAATDLAIERAHSPAVGSPTQSVVSSLSILPEAELLIYVNPKRILNEVAPKFMPPKDLEGMRKGFADMKTQAGVDPSTIEYLVIAIRFKKPTADLQFQPPEFLVVSGGDFSAESLMGMARMASQGKLREEKYADKTLGLMTIDPLVKEAQKMPFLKSFTEVAIAPLNANTIATGSPGYLKAAIDAAGGGTRISADTLNSLVRDPNALISIAGTPWNSFAKSFGLLGTDANPRAPRCEMKMGDFYAALTIDATNVMLRGALNEDNPDTARIISNLFSMFLKGAAGSIKDPMGQTMLNALAINAEGDEVTIRADIPQVTLMELIRKQMAPKKVEAAATSDATKPPAKKRRTRRRGK